MKIPDFPPTLVWGCHLNATKIQDKAARIPTYTSVGLPLTIILRCKNGKSRSLDLKDKKASNRDREEGLPRVRVRKSKGHPPDRTMKKLNRMGDQ